MPALTDYPGFLAACEAFSEADKAALEQLLHAHGVAAQYIEFSGNIAHIPLSDRVDVLQFKGVDLFTDSHLDRGKLQEACDHAATREWHRPLAVATVLSPGGREGVRLVLTQAQVALRWQWQVVSETGQHWQQEFCPTQLRATGEHVLQGVALSARELFLAPFHTRELAPGYHRLTLRCLEGAQEVLEGALIVAPARCFEPEWTLAGQRLWGFSVQLYTLRSARNWGMGDFSDLQTLIGLAAEQGAHFLVLNPLHALNLQYPEHCSPYSPNDRRRLNALYIDPESEPEFAGLGPWLADPATQTRLQDLRSRDAVDYAAVAALKLSVLAQMFEYFVTQHLVHDSPRARAFQTFVTASGPALLAFATLESTRLAGPGFPPACSDPRFTLYTQWLAELQLEACQRSASAAGMAVGLVRDLAVGGDGGGAEVSLNGALFRVQASIGAPPDPLAPQGQNWGLPPLDPQALQDTGYQHFIDLLQTNMAHCGALRIDHVMALMRLWWCPRFPGRGIGAYVHYPVEDLFALLRLESARNRCLVIGEDLGVVPPEVRAFLSQSAVFSNVLFYFEKYDGFHFKRPEHYNPRALAMVANHDVPTLAAWWNGSDLRLRHSLGLIATPQLLAEQLLWRRAEKQQVLRWLADQWLLPPAWQEGQEDQPFDLVLCAAIFRCNGRSSSQLLSLQLEDLALVESPVNIPGTSSEYPNWRRRLPVPLEALLASERGTTLLAGLKQERSPR